MFEVPQTKRALTFNDSPSAGKEGCRSPVRDVVNRVMMVYVSTGGVTE